MAGGPLGPPSPLRPSLSDRRVDQSTLHCHHLSGTHPHDFVIVTILNGVRLNKTGFGQALTSVLRL